MKTASTYLLLRKIWAEYQETRTDFVCVSGDKETLRAFAGVAFPEIIWENDVAVIAASDDGYGITISEEYFEIVEIEKV